MTFGFSGRRSGQLPAQVTSFVGRTAELADVGRTLERARLVSLVGPGGVGKTRLALHSAIERAELYADGVRLVELSGLKDPELLPHTIATALDLPEQCSRPRIDLVVEYLAERELLLILDTCEHVLDSCAMLADLLLPEAPGLTLLTTSRQPLDVPGEHVLTVPPLPLPGEPGEGDGGALALFADRAAAVVPGFTLTDANRAQAVALCRRLDGIPLAIELATVRLRALPLDELAERLGDTFALLAGGRLTTLSRHQTLRTTIGWSHELCTAPERLLWARLSVFAGTFELAAVEEVCTDPELPPGEVVQHLISLVDKSVVLRVENGGTSRYRLLDTIREYGAEWLESLGETAACRDRHIAHYRARLLDFERRFLSSQQFPLHSALADDHDNLRAALEYAVENDARTEDGDDGEGPAESASDRRSGGLAMTAAMWPYWACGGLLTEGTYWMDKALAAPPCERSGPDRAKTLVWYGFFAVMLGCPDDALPRLHEGRALAERIGDRLSHAWAVGFEGAAYNFSGDHERALTLTDEAVALARETGERLPLVMACYAKGLAHALVGRPDEALAACEEGLRELGPDSRERWNQGYLLIVKGFAYILRGQREECAESARRAAQLKGDIGDVMGVAYSLSLLAWVSSEQGRHRRAAWLLGASLEQWRVCGDSRFGGIEALELVYAAVEATLRDALGDERFERTSRQGKQLTQAQAVLLAANDTDTLPTVPRQPLQPDRSDRSDRSGARPVTAWGGGADGARTLVPDGAGGPGGAGSGAEVLTRREREVAGLVAEGLSNREIAERLVISKRTADAHIEHILAKLGFSSRAEITALLGRDGEVRTRHT
ncbi:LuxR C-terminal-related transcriptional regulator [Streptomyces sp. NPDC054796]